MCSQERARSKRDKVESNFQVESLLLYELNLVWFEFNSRKTKANRDLSPNIVEKQVFHRTTKDRGHLLISKSVPPELSLDTRLVVLRLLSPRLTKPGRDRAPEVKGGWVTNSSGYAPMTLLRRCD